MLSDVAVGAMISAVTTGFFAILWQRFHNVRPNKRLNEHLSKRLDALAATALELAVEDATEIEEASLSFTQVADRLLASGLVTPGGHQELLDLWEVRNGLAHESGERGPSNLNARHFLARTEKLIGSLGSMLPS